MNQFSCVIASNGNPQEWSYTAEQSVQRLPAKFTMSTKDGYEFPANIEGEIPLNFPCWTRNKNIKNVGLENVNGFPDQNVDPNAAPHDDIYYSFTHLSRTGIWLPGAQAGRITPTVIMSQKQGGWIQNPAGITQPRFVAYRFDGSFWEEYRQAGFSLPPAGGNPGIEWFASIPIDDPGYYAFEFETAEAVTNDGSPGKPLMIANIGVYSAVDTYGFHALPFFDSHVDTMQNMRVGACSLMSSPLAPTLVEAGQMVGWQTPSNSSPFDNSRGDILDFDRITEFPNAVVMPYKGGMYGFHKPNSVTELELVRPVRYAGTTVQGTSAGPQNNVDAPILTTSGWVLLVTKVPYSESAGVITAASAQIYTTVCFGVEYQSIDQWILQAIPKLPHEEFVRMLHEVRDIPQFHCNPMHFSDIMNWVKRAGSHAMKVAPTLIRALKTIGPMVPMGPQGRTLALLASEIAEMVVEREDQNPNTYHDEHGYRNT
jgi:hypothetical protein